MQVSIVPVPSIVQPAGGTGTGPASAGPLNASDSAPAATVPRKASRKRRPIGRPARPAAVIPPGQAHTFVIEFPTAPRYNLRDIDIKQNRARLSRSPAAEVQIPKARQCGNTCEKSPERFGGVRQKVE